MHHEKKFIIIRHYSLPTRFIAFSSSNYSSNSNIDANMLPQQYCLRWKYHHSNLQTMFSQLLDRGCFCDVTLACDGQTLKAHRVVLSACSTYFDSILTNCNSEKDPIIILKDVKFMDIKYLVEFMYKGEINVEHVSRPPTLRLMTAIKLERYLSEQSGIIA